MGRRPQRVGERGSDHLTEREGEADSAQQGERKSREEKPRPSLKAGGLQLAIAGEELLPSLHQKSRRRKLPGSGVVEA